MTFVEAGSTPKNSTPPRMYPDSPRSKGVPLGSPLSTKDLIDKSRIFLDPPVKRLVSNQIVLLCFFCSSRDSPFLVTAASLLSFLGMVFIKGNLAGTPFPNSRFELLSLRELFAESNCCFTSLKIYSFSRSRFKSPFVRTGINESFSEDRFLKYPS